MDSKSYQCVFGAFLVSVLPLASFGCQGESGEWDGPKVNHRISGSDVDGGGEQAGDGDHEALHLNGPPSTTVEFGEPVGRASARPILEIYEAKSPDRNWAPDSRWRLKFYPKSVETRRGYEFLSIRLPAGDSYADLERRYELTAGPADASEPQVLYQVGDEALYGPEEEAGTVEIRSVRGTHATLSLDVRLSDGPNDHVKIDKTFEFEWVVFCNAIVGRHTSDSAVYETDTNFETEFCQQFLEPPWPHLREAHK